jgi:predicted small integral membrane protein
MDGWGPHARKHKRTQGACVVWGTQADHRGMGCVWDHACALECIHLLILCGETVYASKYKRTQSVLRVDTKPGIITFVSLLQDLIMWIWLALICCPAAGHGRCVVYIDPNTGGILFQVLATAFAVLSGTALLFSRQIRAVFARAVRRLRELRGSGEREEGPAEPRSGEATAQERGEEP